MYIYCAHKVNLFLCNCISEDLVAVVVVVVVVVVDVIVIVVVVLLLLLLLKCIPL